jgi:hypothetical protein
MRTLLLTLALTLLFAIPTFGQERISGLNGICVRTTLLGGENSGLSESQIQTDTELTLRKASIPVLEGRTPTAAKPCLTVRVSLFKTGAGDYVADVFVELDELATSKRRPSLDIVGSSWGRATMLEPSPRDGLRDVRNEITDIVNTFANDYLRANPKRDSN